MKNKLSLSLFLLLFLFFIFPFTASADVGDNMVSESEVNDTIAKADTIKPDYTVSGTLDYSDLDYFKFTVSEQTLITIICTSSYDDPLFVICNSSDEILAMSADLGYDEDGDFYTDAFIGTVNETGTYYLVLLNQYEDSYSKYSFYYDTEPVANLKIKTQPADKCAPLGSNVSTSVTATGNGLTYEWYIKDTTSKNFTLSSVSTNKYSYKMTEAKSGRQVYCVITDIFGNSVKTRTATLSAAATITQQPQNATAAFGEKIQSTINAIGNNLTYQWYLCNPGKTTFSKSSVTSPTYSCTMSEKADGRRIYCIVKDSFGNSVKSDIATLTMDASLAITKEPADTCTPISKTAKTTVTTTGNDLTYTWYIKDVTSETFSLSSIKTNTYSYKMTEAKSGRQVYCVITDGLGNSVTTRTATLSAPVFITQQPESASAASGATLQSSVGASGLNLTYQWYLRNSGQTKFSKSSVITDTYFCTMSEKSDGRQIYCIITDGFGNSVTSEIATLTMKKDLSITTEPADKQAQLNKVVKTSVTAVGEGLSYTWYVKDATSDDFTLSSITTNTYSVKMTEAKSGRQVYCIITDADGNNVQTRTATLSAAVTIINQPADISAESGEKIKTSVTAYGNNLSYQWYLSNSGQSKFSKSSIVTDTYSCTMSEKADGRKVYCIITDEFGNTVTSDIAVLTAK